MTRAPSTLSRIIAASAEQLAKRWNVPPENRQAFAQTAASIFEAQFSALRGGERLWTPQRPSADRTQRQARIVAALSSGEGAATIAQREGVSPRYVRKLRACAAELSRP
jgi:DNA-binding NarL/FixJ family response regulator